MDANPCHVENARLNTYTRRVSEAAGRDNKQTIKQTGLTRLHQGLLTILLLHYVFKQYKHSRNNKAEYKQYNNSLTVYS